MKRRSFLQGLGAIAAFALFEGPLTSEVLRPKELPIATEGGTGEWVYNVSLGVFQNEELTASIQRRAAIRAGRRWKKSADAPIYLRGSLKESQEFGRPYGVSNILHDEWYVDSMIDDMVVLLKSGARWRLLPELRASVPTDFGRHKMVAWYGIAEAA